MITAIPRTDDTMNSPVFVDRIHQAQSSSSSFELFENKEYLDSSIAFLQSALDSYSQDSTGRVPILTFLAYGLCKRYELLGDSSDLESAVTSNRASLDLRPDGLPEMCMSLYYTGTCLLRRYEREGQMADIEEAISLHRAALDLTPDGHPDRFVSLYNTANCLSARYEREGRMADLEEAIFLHRAALSLVPDGHPDKPSSLNNTARCVSMRYECEGGIADLEEAISLHRAALALMPECHQNRPIALNNTASCLLMRYGIEGRVADVEGAISLHRAALALTPDGHPGRVSSLTNTANCIMKLHGRDGRMADLEEAIFLYRAALNLTPDGHPNRSATLNNTAGCLSTRYEREGRIVDLEEAISLYRAALALMSECHPGRSIPLNNAANCLVMRYECEGNVADLEEAIALHRAVLNLRAAGHPGRSRSLSDTASCLSVRYERDGRTADLYEAITLHTAVLDLIPDGHPGKFASLNNTANCLLRRYLREGGLSDLDESIAFFRAALCLTPDGHPNRSEVLYNTANCLSMLYELCGRQEVLEGAISFLSCSAAHAFSSFSIRLRAARRWASIARFHGHDTLVEGYRSAMSVLQYALTTRPSLSEQHKFLVDVSDFQMLAMDAASSAIDKDDLCQAVEFLEQGRALLWSQLRGFRTPLEQLSQVNKSLADRFEDCSRRLEALISTPEPPTLQSGVGRNNNQAFGVSPEKISMDQLLAQMRQLHEEQEIIVDEIRCIDGFEGFLQATPFAMLRHAASEGPVIVLNHSRLRCDALIVLSREDDPCVCVPLDEGFYSDAIRLHGEFLRFRREFKVHTGEYDYILRQVMKFLWDRVVSKVVRKLKELGVVEGSRIWWCPMSVLTAFPFHAAGPYQGENGKLRYPLDDYISSYAPTLTSLINSRSGTSAGSRRMLFVADTKLPAAERERTEIGRVRRIKNQLLDGDATPDSVLLKLQKIPWVRFVCHGTLDEEPFNSRLEISGGGLRLLDIARANLPNAEFAFLSACHTAEQGPRYALDEALHLAAAMQFCGFKSVVGTMWQVLDRDGPFLSEKVYAFLKYGVKEDEVAHKKAAAAVRDAALRLRERLREELIGDEGNTMTERWVNLVHIGA